MQLSGCSSVAGCDADEQNSMRKDPATDAGEEI